MHKPILAVAFFVAAFVAEYSAASAPQYLLERPSVERTVHLPCWGLAYRNGSGAQLVAFPEGALRPEDLAACPRAGE
jgi:hypothetical protein